MSNSDDELKAYLTNEKWNEFDDSYLRNAVKIEDTELGGFTRKQSDELAEENNIHVGSMEMMGFGDSNAGNGNKYEMLNNFLKKIQNFYTHQQNENEDQEEEVEEDPIEEPEEENSSPQKRVNANYDSLDDDSEKSNEWRKQDPELNNELARSDKGFWNSNKRDHEESWQSQGADDILAINRPLNIIEVEVGDSTIVNEYSDNHYWTKPRDSGINVDDILKEIEGL